MANIALAGVHKAFNTKGGQVVALDKIDLEIADNEFVAIVGASGCGKSTLLNLVAGFDQPTLGRVSVNGQQVTRPGPDRGVVFQEIALFPWLTVRENIAYGLQLRASRRSEPVDALVTELLRRVNLEAFEHQYPSQLSGGMRQRVAIARVLAIDPDVLLMDEPFGALDSLTRSLMQDFLLEIWEENRKTVLFITHDIDEAIYLADRVVVMSSRPGRIREVVGVNLPRPRDLAVQSSQRFIHLRERVTAMVREEATKANGWRAVAGKA